VSILDQVTDRLRRGLAVETVRTPDGWRMLTPGALPACGIVVGEHETYQVEYVGHRPGGDIDVVVSCIPHADRPPTYLAVRQCGETWRPLAGGRDMDLASAVHRAEHETRWAGWDSPELTALLNTVEAT
jgi:hypothetical protein